MCYRGVRLCENKSGARATSQIRPNDASVEPNGGAVIIVVGGGEGRKSLGDVV